VNPILDTLTLALPPRRKNTPSGWISFDAVCCSHRGESQDTKKRGGILLNEDSFQYHCFNCGFKAGWSVGKLFTANTKSLMRWLGISDSDISQLSLYALKTKDQALAVIKPVNLTLETRALPDHARPIRDLCLEDLDSLAEQRLHRVIEYILERGHSLDWYPWYYSDQPGYQERVIIPFYEQGRLVGHTARLIREGKPKYLTDSQSGYVFNMDAQTPDRSAVIVVEGQFDAIGIDGVAIMTNEPNAAQVKRIQQLNRQVIVVPDRDRAGAKMIRHALNNGWAVSMPPWPEGIKDVSDCVRAQGRLYTLTTILHYAESNTVKIQLMERKLQHA